MKTLTSFFTVFLLCIATMVNAAYPEGFVPQPHDHKIQEIHVDTNEIVIQDGSHWYIRDGAMLAKWQEGDLVRVMDLNIYPGDEQPEYTMVVMNIHMQESSEAKEVQAADPDLLPEVVEFQNDTLTLSDGSKWKVPHHLSKRAKKGLFEGSEIAVRRTLTWAYSYLLFTDNGIELQAKALTQ